MPNDHSDPQADEPSVLKSAMKTVLHGIVSLLVGAGVVFLISLVICTGMMHGQKNLWGIDPAHGALWLVLAVVAAYCFVPPILIFLSQKFPRVTQLVPFESLANAPEAIRFYLEECGDALEELGFVSVGRFALPDPVPHVKAFVELYANRRQRDSAMVTCIYGVAAPQAVQQVRYVEFVTRFRNDDLKLLQTNNYNDPGAFPAQRDELTFRFPKIDDLAALYRLHQLLLDRHASRAAAYLRIDDEFAGDAADYLQFILAEGYEQQVENGLLRFDDAGNCWRPTTYGACRMTWQEMWPWKPIRMLQVRQKEARLLAELEASAMR